MRYSAAQNRGEVLLEVVVPCDRVLLSGFDDWHCVLNSSLLVPVTAGEDNDEWWARAEPMIEDFAARVSAAGFSNSGMQDVRAWPDDLRTEIETSWLGVFDRSQWDRDEYVQAVVHEIRAEDVVRVTRIR
ncbi:MAG: DUF3841 domain-containing protein [Nocardioides sp.]|uniref:DUF3841 domain-containing protein n=1 Tax=Nocardioides sp. TaxID=35761 RepID=UPI003F08A726